MKIDHIHFFVEDATAQCQWFIDKMGCHFLGTAHDSHTETGILQYGGIDLWISSAVDAQSPVAHYLAYRAPGVADIAFQVDHLNQILQQYDQSFASERPLIQHNSSHRWVTLKGWGSVQHTLIESHNALTVESFRTSLLPELSTNSFVSSGPSAYVDHVVLNVPTGDLSDAVQFYERLLGLERQQNFHIETSKSGLRSQVLYAPTAQFYFNINEPTVSNSQIQVFLEANGGAGVQHIALRSEGLCQEIGKLRQRGLPFLSVPRTYYQTLKQRLQENSPFPLSSNEWKKLISQEILLDWQPDHPGSFLLQIFSKPIFAQPTFFLSLLSVVSRLKGLVRQTSRRFMKPLNPSWMQFEGQWF